MRSLPRTCRPRPAMRNFRPLKSTAELISLRNQPPELRPGVTGEEHPSCFEDFTDLVMCNHGRTVQVTICSALGLVDRRQTKKKQTTGNERNETETQRKRKPK